MKERTAIAIFWIIVIAGMALILSSGCTQMHKQTQREMAWTEIAKQTAHNQFKMTAFQVTALKTYMGDRMSELPVSTVAAIEQVLDLALNYNPETVTDIELAEMYALRARIFCDLVKQIVGSEFWRYLSL